MAFVYTRCRDARECPLITARFAQLQQKFAGTRCALGRGHARSGLRHAGGPVSLRANVRRRPVALALATGDPERVLDFAAQFDVTAFPDERVGLIHPERLVMLDHYGAIRELIDEGAWTPNEIYATVRNDERLASNPFELLDLWLSSAAVSVCGNAVADSRASPICSPSPGSRHSFASCCGASPAASRAARPRPGALRSAVRDPTSSRLSVPRPRCGERREHRDERDRGEHLVGEPIARDVVDARADRPARERPPEDLADDQKMLSSPTAVARTPAALRS
jgi:hypothetical protein